MKNFLQSLNIFNVLGEVVARFPLPFICATILTILGLLEIADIISWDELYRRLFATCFSAFFGLTSLKLFSENHKISGTKNVLLSILIVSLTYYIIITHEGFWTNFATYYLGTLLTLTFAPFIFSKTADKAQCNFNASLISNVFFTTLSLVILFGGVSLILLSLKYLLEVPITSKTYGYVWTFGALFFTPILFLSKLPRNFDNTEELKYPKGLSFNLEYLVAPLLVIYALVLYAYGVKILFEYDLPKGRVAYLVTAFGFIGIFAFSMLQPVTEAKNIFVKLVRNYFYHILIVPLILLIIGVWTRVSDYGITEPRYILMLTTFWFVITTTHIVLKKDASLKFINISLSVLLILASFGPWRVTEVSANSQISRFEKILIENNILIDGKIQKVKNQNDIDVTAAKDITSIARYIASNNLGEKIEDWFIEKEKLPQPFKRKGIARSYNYFKLEQEILNRIGISNRKNVNQRFNRANNVPERFNIYSQGIDAFKYFPNISEYDRVIHLNNVSLKGDKAFLKRLGSTEEERKLSEYKRPKLDAQIINNESEFVIDDANYKDRISINIRDIVLNAHEKTKDKRSSHVASIKEASMKETKENDRFKISVFIYRVSAKITTYKDKQNEVDFDNISLVVLLKDKKL